MSTEEAALEILATVDKALADPNLLDEPRAVLLLRLCQMARISRPALFQRYWAELQKISGKVPADQQEALASLQAAGPPSKEKKGSKLTQEVAAAVAVALEQATTDPQAARRTLEASEERLRKHWWPAGKGPAWAALLQGWARLDRSKALQLLGQVPAPVQRGTLAQLNGLAPLTPEEWDLACERGASASALSLIKELLDQEKPALRLGGKLVQQVGQSLLAEGHQVVAGQDEQQAEKRLDQATARYMRLFGCVLPESAEQAEALLEALFTTTATSDYYKEKWARRFGTIDSLVRFWVDIPQLREKGLAFISQKAPRHLRDLSLAQWYGSIPTSDAEAADAYATLLKACQDQEASEAWFLVRLVQRGMAESALNLARSSPHAAALRPRLRRACLVLGTSNLAALIPEEEVQGQPVDQFLYLSTAGERAGWLRQQTANGTRSLPTALWSEVSFSSLMRALQEVNTSGKLAMDDGGQQVNLGLHSKLVPPENQFRSYLKINGFGQYTSDVLDPHLLAAMVAWDDKYPNEVQSVLANMWNVMKPSPDMLRMDVLRNGIFERCYTVFAAHPTSLNELFVRWVKREMVDKSMQQQVGTTIYTFSLNPMAPFLQCLLGAQKVAGCSAKRCDEIIAYAIRDYTANEGLIMAAADLYASDKGLPGLTPPAQLKNRGDLKAWQMGVIQASAKRLLLAMLLSPDSVG